MEACETRRRLRVAGFTRARYHRELGGGLFASGIINLGERRERERGRGGSQEFPQEEEDSLPPPPYTAATMSPEAVSLLLFRITCQGKSHHCSLYGPRCHFLPRRNFLLLLLPPPPPLLRPLFSTRSDFPRGSAIVNKLVNEEGGRGRVRANFSPPSIVTNILLSGMRLESYRVISLGFL